MDSRLRSAFEAAVGSETVPGIAAAVIDREGNNLFSGAFGTVNMNDASATLFTADTAVQMFSCTKLVTSVAALQLVEQGKLALDDPVEKHLPNFGKLQVFEGLEDGKPVLRAPKTRATVLHLFTHTAGFSYDFLDGPTAEWRTALGQTLNGYGSGAMRNFEQALRFDPGTAYLYGVNTDWLGFVVEAISNMPLDEYVDKHILQPLGMHRSGSRVKAGQTRLALHFRDQESRSLVANPAITAPEDPEKFGGGHYMYSTLNDYSTFLSTLLNYGKHPTSGARVLEEATVRDYVFKDHLDKICSNEGVGVIKAVSPMFAIEGELLPSVDRGWSCGLMMSRTDSPRGRPRGSGGWAGLGNAYYWLDPVAGKAGLIMSTIFPFMDREVLHLFDELERAAYGHRPAEVSGEPGSNFRLDPTRQTRL